MSFQKERLITAQPKKKLFKDEKKLPGKFIPLVVMDMTTLREGAVPFFPFFFTAS